MLIEMLERLDQYSPVIAHLEDGLHCLKAHKDDAAPTRISFPGGFMMLQQGTTKSAEEGDYEAHKAYLDVQVLLEGNETVIWADTANLTETVPYDEEKDKVMYTGSGSAVEIRPGMCYFCWPHDAHKACRHQDQAAAYRKAVIKLKIDPQN